MPDAAVTLADIDAAAANLDGVIRDLPLAGAQWLERLVGGEVRLVTENLQRAGSFKIRGAYHRISRLTDEERARGVVAASAGNHAQGVAVAAQLLGVRATVFMPDGATIPKVQATLGYGADVRFHGDTIEQALDAAREFADETGAVLIHPFDHADVIAGQGTLGLEIMAKMPEVRTVVVCTGGGGLLAGVALAVKSIDPTVRVVGVQADSAAAYPASLAAGHPVLLESMATMADGIAVGRPGDVPFAIVQRLVDEVMTVTEEQIVPRRPAAARAREARGRAGGRRGDGGGARPPGRVRAARRRGRLRWQRRLDRPAPHHPARPGGGRPLSDRGGAHARPARLARPPAQRHPGDARQRRRHRAQPGRLEPAASTRSTSSCTSRRAGPTTATPCWPT